MKQKYPYDGELFPAKDKKFEEIIFFVPFFEGSKKKMKRHVEMVNELGYDAFAFTLQDDFSITRPPISSKKIFGFKHLYADQIEDLLNRLPGKKIIFSFSNPTAAAIEAMTDRNCQDVAGLICDSGPSAKFMKSVKNLYSSAKSAGPFPVVWMITPLFSLVWSWKLHEDLKEQLHKFPKDFPILSIRGWKDDIIPPDHIDAAFDPHPHLDLQKLALPEGGHLNGLRDFPDQYLPAVTRFLKAHSTPLKSARA